MIEPAILVEACVVIVRDPDEEGGFSRGARFSLEEVRMMLAAGHFTVGTRLVCPRYGELEVVEYSYPIKQERRVRHIQALKGNGYYLLPNTDGVGHKLLKVGLNGPQRIR